MCLWARPGDYLPPENQEIPGFKQRLNERLAPIGSQFTGEGVNEGEWEIGDTLAQWWRPNFETFMYPFLPAHVTRPKECKKLYFVKLPRSSTSIRPFHRRVRSEPAGLALLTIQSTEVLSVPKNMKLLAVPLFELYDNTARYGPQLSAIPHLLSRYNFEFVDEDGNVCAATPGGDPGPQSVKVLATTTQDGGDHTNGTVKQEDEVKEERLGEDIDIMT